MRIVRYYPRALNGDGGMTAAVSSAARAVARLGTDVSVIYEPSGPGSSAVSSDGVSWFPVPHRGPPGLRAPVQLDDLIRDADLMVLHSGWTSYNLVAASVARRLGVPYVLEPRGAYNPNIVFRRRVVKAAWWRHAEGHMVDRALAVHLFFASEREHLTRLGYEGHFIVSPNGVRVPEDQRWDGGSGGYLLWLGRFDSQHKGLDLLLDAMTALPTRRRPLLRLHGPDWRGQKKQIVEAIATRRLGDWVVVGPAVHGDEKSDLVSRARAFVYPSRWEGFGNSVAEAAALGVPLLTTIYPLGLFLKERSAAITCAPTAAALASGIDQVLQPEAAALGKQAREIAETELSWERVARSWLTQVERLL